MGRMRLMGLVRHVGLMRCACSVWLVGRVCQGGLMGLVGRLCQMSLMGLVGLVGRGIRR
jgi:hypothetical protein